MNTPYSLSVIEVDDKFQADPAQWLIDQAYQHQLRYLLAHADDGVIWGRVDGDRLHTSHGIAPSLPALNPITLHQLRLFGLAGELLMWRDDKWHARFVADVQGNENDIIDEDQLLWGNVVEKITDDGFTLVREGVQGMRHAVPIVVKPEQLKHHELRLRVRHYLVENEDGEARIVLSRLVQLLPA
jgi:CRISPR-associated protein (TIGR03984 family)